MALYSLNISPIDRYLHSLLHNNKLWKLVDTNIVAMCDFSDDEGNLKFVICHYKYRFQENTTSIVSLKTEVIYDVYWLWCGSHLVTNIERWYSTTDNLYV